MRILSAGFNFEDAMSEIGDDFRAIREEKRARLEPDRMRGTKEELLRLGCRILPGPDAKSFKVCVPNGPCWNFWPYSGWWAGPKQGRGFAGLRAEIESVNEALAETQREMERDDHDEEAREYERGKNGPMSGNWVDH